MAESDNFPTNVNLDEIQKKRIRAYKTFDKVDYIDKPVSYTYFFHNYLLPNKLCIIGPWLTELWSCRSKWKDQHGSPNLNFLQEKFGDTVCPIANCNKEEYSSHPKSELSFSDYVDYLKRYRASGYSEQMPCLYLKDWHCVRSFPQYDFYETPLFFQSDWLNEFWDERSDNVCDDYRFVYVGPKGSWTPFHSDVLRSYSWSANICGRKKWIFFPPGAEEPLKDKYGQLPFDLRSEDTNQKPVDVDAVERGVEVYQYEGEVVFVPSGWHHQVFNLEDTISVNHNWLNGCNLDICWLFVQQSYGEVMREIADCRDMDGWSQQCQLILKSTSGIDYKEFYQFIELIARNRIQRLEELKIQPETAMDSVCSEDQKIEKTTFLEVHSAVQNIQTITFDKKQTYPETLSTELSRLKSSELPDIGGNAEECSSRGLGLSAILGNAKQFLTERSETLEFIGNTLQCSNSSEKPGVDGTNSSQLPEVSCNTELCSAKSSVLQNLSGSEGRCYLKSSQLPDLSGNTEQCSINNLQRPAISNCITSQEYCTKDSRIPDKSTRNSELPGFSGKTEQCSIEGSQIVGNSGLIKDKGYSNSTDTNSPFKLNSMPVNSASVTNSREHVVFDLKRILDVLDLMVKDEHFMEIYLNDSTIKPLDLRERLSKVLKL